MPADSGSLGRRFMSLALQLALMRARLTRGARGLPSDQHPGTESARAEDDLRLAPTLGLRQ